MSTSAESVRVTAENLRHIADNMRQCDRDEVWASQRLDPLHSLVASIELSNSATVMVLNGEIAGVYGLVHDKNGGSVPWFLGTDVVSKYPRLFVRHCKEIVEMMSKVSPYLVNFVYEKSTESIKFLKVVGFTVEETPMPVGADGELFHRFSRGKVSCAIQ